ncbi:MAG: cysteine desulfurase [Vallitaleaceae bacterium]|nr:cysteine desulfurase [Vallitaleaceae bacterium]
MNIYFDNAATTRTMDCVIDQMVIMLRDHYGNPSSLHYKGIEAEKEITQAKEIFAKLLKVEKKEILFTSGGTESNNLALLGIAKAYVRSGKHIILSSIEHPSVSAVCKQLLEDGYEITTLQVDGKGQIDLKMLEDAIRKDTILVSIMHVNNEIGTIAPLEKIGQLIKKSNPNTLFHVDAVQSFGKIWLTPKRALIDCMSMSGHKIHGPKGIGALYLQPKVKIKSIVYGGSQQGGIRSGTENTSGIAGFSVAAAWMYDHIEQNKQHLMNLKLKLRNDILQNIEKTYVNGPDPIMDEAISVPNILNIRFEGVRGEVLLHALESKGIFVSTGAACASNKHEPSATLTGIGLKEEEIESAIRFSFSFYNTVADVDYCIEQLKEIVPMLRKFTRK